MKFIKYYKVFENNFDKLQIEIHPESGWDEQEVRDAHSKWGIFSDYPAEIENTEFFKFVATNKSAELLFSFDYMGLIHHEDLLKIFNKTFTSPDVSIGFYGIDSGVLSIAGLVNKKVVDNIISKYNNSIKHNDLKKHFKKINKNSIRIISNLYFREDYPIDIELKYKDLSDKMNVFNKYAFMILSQYQRDFSLLKELDSNRIKKMFPEANSVEIATTAETIKQYYNNYLKNKGMSVKIPSKQKSIMQKYYATKYRFTESVE